MRRGDRRRASSPALTTLLLLAAAGAPAGAEEPEPGTLPLVLAKEIARAFYECAERKGKPRSIHIIDRSGATVYAGRMDGQIADNVEVALLKARSALYFRESTEHARKLDEERPLHAHLTSGRGQFTSPVGLPIIVEGELVGALGIGGASGDCAREALSVAVGGEKRP